MSHQELEELAGRIYAASKAQGFTTPDTETSMMLIITELSEAVDAHRKGIYAQSNAYREALSNTTYPPAIFKEFIKDTVEDELADTVIRCLDSLARYDSFKHVCRESVDEEVTMDFLAFTGAELPVMTFGLVRKLCSYKDNKYQVLSIADALYYVVSFLFTWCTSFGIDLAWHIKQKMMYNATRPFKNNKFY